MTLFLRQLQRNYDVVLIDSPPALEFAETRALAKGVSGAVLVVKAGVATIDSVKQSKEAMEAEGVEVLGAALNFAPPKECIGSRS